MPNKGKKRRKDLMKPIMVGLIIVALVVTPAFLIGMSITDPRLEDPPTVGTDPVVFIGISNVEHTPVSPTSQEQVAVSCSVNYAEDDDSIATVTLHYDNGIFSEYSIPMTGAATYRAVIPSQPNGYTVKFWIRASTLGGAEKTSAEWFYTVNDPLPPPPPPPDEPPESDTVLWELLSYDSNNAEIPNIQTAEISGTVRFDVIIHEGMSLVYKPKLQLTGISPDASPTGTWYFIKLSDTKYTLDFDTTMINNGQYLFEFILLLTQETDQTTGGGGTPGYYDVVMSSFLLSQTESGGTLGTLYAWLPLLIVFIIILGGVTIYIVQKNRKKGRKR